MPNTPPYEKLEDQELLKLYKQHHDKQCLGVLLQRYTLLLLGVCLKYLKTEEDAKDAVQQVFSKVITEADKYPIEHFKSWLYTVARNYCFMQLRHKMRNLPEDAIDADATATSGIHEGLERAKEKEKLLQWLEEALALLQPHQRTCVSLFYLQKQSYQQISDTTGLTLLQVKSFIQNGKRNMKQMIEKQRQAHEA